MKLSTKKWYKNSDKGFGLIEIIIATTIISTSLFMLSVVVQLSFRLVTQTFLETKAEFLAEEGVEVVRILRDTSWSSEIASTTSQISYYPVFASSTSMWQLTTSDPGLIDQTYIREVIFDDVYRRDLDDDIVASTSPDVKTLDPGTKHVTSRVMWSGGEHKVEFVTYITDIFNN